MKTVKWIVGILAGGIVLLLIVGLCLPRQFRVERSVTIDAPAEKVHAVVSRFRDWPTWTAWNQERFPDLKMTYDGPAEGVGAKSHWTSEAAGTGDMEITASDPAKGVAYDLAFDDGAMLSQGGIDYAPSGGDTLVTWHAEGDLGWNPVGRYFGLLMDGMMGPDFEKGLANLKRRVEADAQPQESP
jgi:uncharacterized membrane protein